MLYSTFHQAKSYAAKAVNAVNAYNEIYRLINSSLNGAIAVNSSVQEITNIVRDIKLELLFGFFISNVVEILRILYFDYFILNVNFE